MPIALSTSAYIIQGKGHQDASCLRPAITAACSSRGIWQQEASTLSQLALGGDIGREMPVPLTAHFQQPQWFAMSVPPVIPFKQPEQLATAGSHGTGMPAATVILFQQPQKLALGRDFGTELPAPSTAHFQQPQQLAIVWVIKTHATKFTSLVLASSPNSKLAPRAQLQPSSDKFTSSPGITSKSLTVDYAPNSPPQPFTSTALYSPHFRLLISQTTPLYSTKQTKTNQYSQLTPVFYFNIQLLLNPFETFINYLPFWKA